MDVIANGIKICYELHGQGPPLVLVHGAGDNLGMWYHQVPAFSARHTVLTYDVRGFGRTGLPPGPYSVRILAEDLFALMGALSLSSASVLGYSMGGRIGLELALDHPQDVKSLILANSGALPRAPTPESDERARRMQQLFQEGNNEAIAQEMTLSAFSPGFAEREPDAFARYRAVKLENDPRGLAVAMAGLFSEAAQPDLSRLRCPVLIVAGELDAYMDASAARALQAALPGSELRLLLTGHASAIEAPQQFNGIVLDFLGRLYGYGV